MSLFCPPGGAVKFNVIAQPARSVALFAGIRDLRPVRSSLLFFLVFVDSYKQQSGLALVSCYEVALRRLHLRVLVCSIGQSLTASHQQEGVPSSVA